MDILQTGSSSHFLTACMKKRGTELETTTQQTPFILSLAPKCFKACRWDRRGCSTLKLVLQNSEQNCRGSWWGDLFASGAALCSGSQQCVGLFPRSPRQTEVPSGDQLWKNHLCMPSLSVEAAGLTLGCFIPLI